MAEWQNKTVSNLQLRHTPSGTLISLLLLIPDNMMFLYGLAQLWQKHAEVLGALETFMNGLLCTRNPNTSQCQTSLLESLGYRFRNYFTIVSHLQRRVRYITVLYISYQLCYQLNIELYLKKKEVLIQALLNLFTNQIHFLILRTGFCDTL